MNSDLLDEYCDLLFGHGDWEMGWDKEGNTVVTFYKKARPEYLEFMEECDD